MLCLIYVIFIIVALYYASHRSCPRMAATAVALRQIWSGGCQSCRNSEASGLSGLEQSPVRSGLEANSPREACVCDVCPCAAIDIVIRTASPVASMFDDAVNILNHVYCHILTSIIDTYDIFTRVLECRTNCRRQAQIVNQNQYDSVENFSFGVRKSSVISNKPSVSLLREGDLNRSTSSSRKLGAFKTKAQSLLRLFDKPSDRERVAKNERSSSGEIEPTIAVERTPKVPTKDKSVNMRFEEESFGTEEKGVQVHPDAESLPSSSRDGASQYSVGSSRQKPKGYFQVSDEKKSLNSSVASSHAYCDRCKDLGKLCVPSCPKNPYSKK